MANRRRPAGRSRGKRRRRLELRSAGAGLKARTRNLRYGFLLVPGAIASSLIALALVLVAVDHAAGEDGFGFGMADDPDTARAVLTVIAGSIATIAGVTFSITMVTLQLVSQQFSPRALRNFLGDRPTQVVAGMFTGVFVYCLIVLRAVSGAGSGGESSVPVLSTTVGIALGVLALALLLVFIDHMSRNIQVSSIAAAIARTTLSALDTLYPAPFGHPSGDDPDALVAAWSEADPQLVYPQRPGYVQAVEIGDVPKQVGSDGLRIAIRVTPGDFVTEGDALAAYWPGEDDGDVAQALRLAVVIANERDMRQDPGYGLRQLADIATRAISPAVNDPTTAWTCIRYMQAVLERLVGRAFPDRVRRYEDADVVVVTPQTRFDEYVEAAYAQVGRYATDPRVAGGMLESIERVIRAANDADATDRVFALVAAAERIAATATEDGPRQTDRDHLAALLDRVQAAAGPDAAASTAPGPPRTSE